MGSGIFLEGSCKYRAHLVQCRDRIWVHACLSDLNKCKTSLGQQRDLDMASGVFFRGLNTYRIHLDSIQGHRGELTSVVVVLDKNRTHPDSVHRPRGGPRSIFWKLEQMCAENCLLEA